MAEYKTQSIEQLVDELLSLNDENLARRVLETSDVQWCLGELYDYLHEDVVLVTRCKDCKHYAMWSDGRPMHSCLRDASTRWDDDFCSYGKRRGE